MGRGLSCGRTSVGSHYPHKQHKIVKTTYDQKGTSLLVKTKREEK